MTGPVRITLPPSDHRRLIVALRRLAPGATGRRLTVEVHSEAGARALRRAILCELDRVW